MGTFRKLYYKFAILFCMFAMFGLLADVSSAGILYGVFCIFVGIVCFGALPVGKENFDTEKPIRNIFAYLMWSLLGFGITATGISFIAGGKQDESLITAAFAVSGMILIVLYIINIIKNKDIFGILSILLLIGACCLGPVAGGILILQILTIIILVAALGCFLISLFKVSDDD